jgi:hypothetical protein
MHDKMVILNENKFPSHQGRNFYELKSLGLYEKQDLHEANLNDI